MKWLTFAIEASQKLLTMQLYPYENRETRSVGFRIWTK